MKTIGQFLEKLNDVLILDIAFVLLFVSKTIKLFFDANQIVIYCNAIIGTCISVLVIIYALSKKGSYFRFKNVSPTTVKIWEIIELLTIVLSIANRHKYDNWEVNIIIYVVTLVVLLSYFSLQIYLYATHKLTFRKR